jgi:hypothetical protein
LLGPSFSLQSALIPWKILKTAVFSNTASILRWRAGAGALAHGYQIFHGLVDIFFGLLITDGRFEFPGARRNGPETITAGRTLYLMRCTP